MKLVVAVVAFLIVLLFYPFHDLYVKDNPFLPHYTLVARGFWTEEACREAAEAQRAVAYRCRPNSAWSRMFSAATHYGHGAE